MKKTTPLRHAMGKAELSIWSDRRLLGMPDIRWNLVIAAARCACGRCDLESADWIFDRLDPESHTVAREAFLAAIEAARSAKAVEQNA